MTTDAMNCTAFADHLMAYLEHETDDATRAALERHALSCHTCGPLLADLRKLRVDAANLPELSPSRDLWGGIAERIQAPVVAIGRGQASPASTERVRRWPTRVAIAASLVAAAGLGYVAARRTPVQAPLSPVASSSVFADTGTRVATLPPADTPAADRTPAATPQAPASEPVRATPRAQLAAAPSRPAPLPTTQQPVALQLAAATVAGLTADYDREIARLRTLIERRRNQMDPATVAIIEHNLAVIDTAIVECKKAIARDPASRFLIESLNQSLQTKMELLRTAALLPIRT